MLTSWPPLVTNTGSQPLWLRLDSNGYPSSAPEPASNVLQIERQILGTDGPAQIAVLVA